MTSEDSRYAVRVDGLSLNVTDQHLREIFSNCGPFRKAEVIRNKFGHSEGWGIVYYENDEQVESAIDFLDGGVLDGLTLRVYRLEPAEPAPASA